MSFTGFPDPGGRFVTRRGQLARRLLAQGTQTGPVGGFTEGLARLGNSLAGALLLRRDRSQEEAANRALLEGLQGQPPGAGLSAGPGSPGGLAGALGALRGLPENNVFAGRLARQLATAQAVSDADLRNQMAVEAMRAGRPSSLEREFLFFREQNPDLTPEEFLRLRATGTTVNVGTPSPLQEAQAAGLQAAAEAGVPLPEEPQTQQQVAEAAPQVTEPTPEELLANPALFEQPARPPTVGQEAQDKEFAKEFVRLTAGGGIADVDKQIEQLTQALATLESGANVTARYHIARRGACRWHTVRSGAGCDSGSSQSRGTGYTGKGSGSHAAESKSCSWCAVRTAGRRTAHRASL